MFSTMDLAHLRAWWSNRQGLDGSLAGCQPAEVLAKVGWARSVGGVAPYLTLWTRARIGREAADKACATLEIHELPSARGCTYVLPASDFALGLKLAQPGRAPEQKRAAQLGVTEKELDKLGAAVVKALAKGPLTPDQIKESVGGAVRHLGEAGKKAGMITTLPVALGALQADGEIRRVPVNGRLDTQRYQYTLWKPNPLAKFKLTAEECHTELARKYFRWIGPATVAEFQWFSGLSGKVAKAAIAPLDLQDAGEGRLIFADDLDAFRAFKPPKTIHYEFVSGIDSMVLLRRNYLDLTEAADQKRIKALGGVSDLESHAVFANGRLAGLWEYDTETKLIVCASFLKTKDKAFTKALGEAETYVREQLEDARSFSLDSPKSRAPRIAELRKAAVG